MLCCDRSKLFYYERQKKTDIKFLNLNVLPAHASEALMFDSLDLKTGMKLPPITSSSSSVTMISNYF